MASLLLLTAEDIQFRNEGSVAVPEPSANTLEFSPLSKRNSKSSAEGYVKDTEGYGGPSP
jgi:hypothetical protein